MIGRIYKIECDVTNLVYYGSTTGTLARRLSQHKNKNNPAVTKNMENPQITLIEEIEFDDKTELYERERWWIENNECCNMKIPLRTHKERYAVNKNDPTKYYQINKERIKNKYKEWYDTNKDKIYEKIECECGLFYTRYRKTRHCKSKRHIDLLNKKNK